jgi:uncharacterized protein (DUF488 family)
VIVYTVGHGARPLDELSTCCARQVPGRSSTCAASRARAGTRSSDGEPLAAAVAAAGIAYRHEAELGGRRSGVPGEERFDCIRVAAFRSYAARMGTDAWQEALERSLAQPAPAFLCAETLWWRCHRRLIAELLHARGHEVRHLLGPGHTEPHRLWPVAEARDGRLYLCGTLVA